MTDTLDRAVASIGNSALTESDVQAECRFELFRNGRPAETAPDAAEFERIRDRLIDQKLLEQEAEAENLKLPDLSRQATEMLNQARAKYATEALYQAALRSLGMDEPRVLERLTRQVRTLWLIDQRLRSSVWVEQAEIEVYYRETFAPEYLRCSGGAAPSLADVENQIREILVQKKIDELLAKWLEELRSSRRLRVHSF